MSDNKMTPFLREGITRYADACATLGHFQREVQSLLAGVLKARSQWGKMQLLETGAVKPGASWSVRDPPHWIEATARGKVNGTPTTLELGVWWELPVAKSPVIVFAAFCAGSPDLLAFEYTPSKTGAFRSFEYAGRTHIAVPVDGTVDVSGCAAAVLDEILQSSGLVVASRTSKT